MIQVINQSYMILDHFFFLNNQMYLTYILKLDLEGGLGFF